MDPRGAVPGLRSIEAVPVPKLLSSRLSPPISPLPVVPTIEAFIMCLAGDQPQAQGDNLIDFSKYVVFLYTFQVKFMLS